ncbi:MAG: guanylate kinase [Cyanobacteria bacterium SIG30]|nr:guanylate kinase [Cyanobacteria bacterium SIG30]
MIRKNPKLFVFTGPSGVGKGTVINQFLLNHKNIKLSVSSTTRLARKGEENGVNYFFVTKEKFEQDIKDEKFLEWAKYNENYYGTSIEIVENFMNQGYDVLLEIEVQGALQVMKKVPDCVSIFILPPNNEELEKRLKGRNTEDSQTILNRLKIAKDELKYADKYKYQVVNDKLENAVEKLSLIYEKEKTVEY